LYKAESPEEIARMMLERRPPRLSEIQPSMPAALDEICATALARHAKSRFANAAEMAQALRSYLAAEGHPVGPGAAAELLGERFAARVASRTKLTRSLISGRFVESEMLELLGASPVLELDFRPAVSGDETIGEAEVLGEASEVDENSRGAFSGKFRVELERVDSERPSSFLREVPSMNLPLTTSHGLDLGGARTQSGQEGAPTLFEPARATADGSDQGSGDSLPLETVSQSVDGSGEGAAQVSEDFEEDTDARWRDATEESPSWRTAPEQARRGVLGRAASFRMDEVTNDTAPSHVRAATSPIVSVIPPRRSPSSGVVVTPIHVPSASVEFSPPMVFASQLVSAPPTPQPGPTPRPSVAPGHAPLGWSSPSPVAPASIEAPYPKIWVPTAFVLGLALGLLIGFLLGRI
jgi:hypothetical protein